jgi:hypothetical protein
VRRLGVVDELYAQLGADERALAETAHEFLGVTAARESKLVDPLERWLELKRDRKLVRGRARSDLGAVRFAEAACSAMRELRLSAESLQYRVLGKRSECAKRAHPETIEHGCELFADRALDG